MKNANLDSMIQLFQKQARREQDLSLIERDNAYINHALNFLIVTGTVQFLEFLKARGGEVYLPEEVLKELGIDVAA